MSQGVPTRNDLTAEQVRAVLDYNPETGVFLWKKKQVQCREDARWNTRYAGKVAGTFDSQGYLQIRVCGPKYLAHRLAWLYVHGSWPAKYLDHIDGDRTNFAIANLREATVFENRQNLVGRQSNNKSGFMGVYYRPRQRKWAAQIGVGGKVLHLGCFDSAEKARDVYLLKKAEIHSFQPVPRGEVTR